MVPRVSPAVFSTLPGVCGAFGDLQLLRPLLEFNPELDRPRKGAANSRIKVSIGD